MVLNIVQVSKNIYMQEIENQTHLLFSSLLRAPKSDNYIHFEGNDYPVGYGPKTINKEGKTIYKLDSNSLLGYGHPLFFKSLLKSTLQGRVHSTSDEVNVFLRDFAQFIFGLGFPKEDWEIFTFNKNISFEENYSGRVKDFFLKGDITELFGIFPFSLRPKKGDKEYLISMADLNLSFDILNFLRAGNIYGEKGIIALREQLLKKHFSYSWVKNVNGLNVFLKKDHPISKERVIFHNNCLRFPLSFDESIINDILKLNEK